MSAFVVSEEHIEALVAAAVGWRVRWLAPEEREESDFQRGEVWGSTAVANAQRRMREAAPEYANEIGRMLLMENARSVAFRYNEELDPSLLLTTIHLRANVHPVVQILKAIKCYEYQSCERPEWEHSESKAFCDALTSVAINHLPGYDAASWEIRG